MVIASILSLDIAFVISQTGILTQDSPSPKATVIGKLACKVDSATVMRLSTGLI
jgi:hypothetical protein